MKQNVISTLSYFSQFSYPATIEELYIFHPNKISKKTLQKQLDVLLQKKIVRSVTINSTPRYIQIGTKGAQSYTTRYNHSLKVIDSTEHHLKFLELIPFIQYLGISGSLSMLNAAQSSDIDIFIITTPGTRWTVRFMVLAYKKVLSLFHPACGLKLCFNLIFAQDGLGISKKKQTEYIGHEILQLKSLYNKSQTYQHLIRSNKWIASFFPNYTPHGPPSRGELKGGVEIISDVNKYHINLSKQPYLISLFENLARGIQTWWLDRKGYAYSERGNQLWLIQKDYEDELRR